MVKEIVIGLDDGHGLETAGKRSPQGDKENEFNHYTKIYLKKELERCGFKIVDCSPSRNDNSLLDRVKRANNGKCDIFISIHFNAMGTKFQIYAEGIETYYHGSSIVGEKLAKIIHNSLMQGSKMNNRGVKSDKVLYANGLYVLRHTIMPAILVECGFMDNKEDLALMKSTAYRKECAREICQGVCKFFDKKYIPEPKESNKNDSNKSLSSNKSYDSILKEVSDYNKVWIDFVKKHPEVNLKGLIQKLYYWKGD